MTLLPGARLGPYEILSLLGAGGMGEVYRARDLKLGRDVAMKVLPATFVDDADRLARFRREAQILAWLNHPNIAAIYGLEESAGAVALAMELAPGEDLAERLARGPIPLDEALAIAKQIVEALEEAHEKGIVHRDLKPGNVKLTPDGRVKLLDFGLAKAFESESGPGSSPSATRSPTLTGRATAAGMILGTAAYMSPEQARGKAVDKRTDIWAFGCVLYEMLTGKRAFEGETVSDTLAAVLREDPDWSKLAVETPDSVRRILRRCLQRDGRLRLHDIADARLDLEETSSTGVEGGPSRQEPRVASGSAPGRSAGSQRPGRQRLALVLPWAIVAVCVVGAGTLLTSVRAAGPKAEAAALTAALLPPEGWNFESLNGPPAFSPDGSELAFVVIDSRAKTQLCVRTLATGASVFVPDSDGARNAFWSPDGKMIGFFLPTAGLVVTRASGSAIEFVAASGPGRGATWGPGGTILYSPALLNSIFRVSPGSRERTAVTTLEESRGETSHQWPHFLPDGRHFIYVVQRVDPVTRRSESEVCVQALGEKERKVLLKAGSRAIYVPGHLLYAWNGSLMAQPFDADRLELTGEAFGVAPRVQYLADSGSGIFAASVGGLLAYAPGGTIGLAQLTVFDRSGKALRYVGGVGNTWTPRLSPDARRLAVESVDAVSSNRDIWTFDVAGPGPPVRQTFDAGEDYTPVFSPDGKRLAFSAFRKGSWFILEKNLSGSDEERVIAAAAPSTPPAAGEPASPGRTLPPGSKFLTDWSPDGRFIAFNTSTKDTADDMWLLAAAGGRAEPFLLTPVSERDTAFSPDGRWVAYVSSETGRAEVYVRSFPGAGGKWQISTGGGTQPRWRRDGQELFYLATGFRLTAVPVRPGPAFEKGTPQDLFAVASRRTNIPQYDVFPDGRSFVVNTVVTEKASGSLSLVQGWAARGKSR